MTEPSARYSYIGPASLGSELESIERLQLSSDGRPDVCFVAAESVDEVERCKCPSILLGTPADPAKLAEAINHGTCAVVDWEKDGVRGLLGALERILPRLRRPIGHAAFQVRLEEESQRALRGGSGLSLAVFDVDGFRDINERDGYDAGDRLIDGLAQLLERGEGNFRLRGCDVASYLGSDRFAIILPDTPRRGAAVVANRLRLACERAAGADYTISVGVAAIPNNANNRRELIDAAVCALDIAKKRGRNRVVTYTPALRAEPTAFEAAVVEADLLLALDELILGKQLRAAYQPIVRPDRSIFGHEVLCRPEHAKFPSPWHLFRLAERAGRVADVGRIVREKAFTHMPELDDEVSLFVNLHPLEVNRDLVTEARDKLEKWSERVVFEVTEAAEIHDVRSFRRLIDELRELGFRIALDDLGAGYAGLNSLTDMQPDFVKLDMELVRRVRTDKSTERLVRHMLEFTQGEGMTIVAEGVEDKEEADLVMEIGCPLLQGYYFAKPGPPFPDLLPA